MKGGRVLFGASVALLALVAVLVIYGSLSSVSEALLDRPDRMGSLTFDQLRSMGAEDAVQAIRGRRMTAATWAMAYGVLFAWVVLGPYRRKERWAWWALLVSLVIPQIVSISRVLFIGAIAGSGVSSMLLAFGLLGLLAGTPRLFLRRIDVL